MITVHWNDKKEMEVPPNASLPASGTIVYRIHRGSKDFSDYRLIVSDPFGVVIATYSIPSLESGEYFEIKFPLGNFLVRGKYRSILQDNEENVVFKFSMYIESRRDPTQVFAAESKLVAKKLKRKVQEISVKIDKIPESFLLQTSGAVYTGRGVSSKNNHIIANNLLGNNQKTITWYNIIQPAFLPIDYSLLLDFPDDYYVLNSRFDFVDEPGLEISHPKLKEYNGYNDPHYPLRVIKDVISYVHKKMRYVRQSKERGLIYALEKGRGDCTEYSAFVVSLLRKNGIKCRLVAGMGRSIHNNWISHAFVEVFIYGSWVPVDVVKPTEPYLQIGNRGDLIALSRRNWLNNEEKDFKIKIQSYNNTSPTFKFNRKVTEYGIKSIPQKFRTKPRKSIFGKIRSQTLNYDRTHSSIIIKNFPENTQSVLIIEGTIKFGKIISMSHISKGSVELPLHPKIKKRNRSIVLLDDKSNIILSKKIKNT